jgi:integrase/recombinase XerD
MQTELTLIPQDAPRLTTVSTDAQLVRLWLHGKSPRTVEAYNGDVRGFFDFVGTDLQELKLEDLQAYADELDEAGLAESTRARKLAAVKSLLTFAHDVGYLRFNVGRAIRLPRVRDRLTERILTDGQVQRLIALEPDGRNRVMMRLMYVTGLRVSEVTGLRWRDLHPRRDSGQITVHGKGEKSRPIVLSNDTWAELCRHRADAGDGEPVFPSRKGGALSRMQVFRIVRSAATRAGITKAVSPHWLRHAHASHALDRGAAVHLVRTTLGHSSLATTSRYTHARPDESSACYLSM